MLDKVTKNLADFHKVHGDFYEYDTSSFVNTNTKMRIKCPDHGWFEQSPKNHKIGKGCRKCAFIRIRKSKSKSPDDIIASCQKVHGNRYEYDISSITNSHSKMRIKCAIHGWFEQSPTKHCDGQGCRKCGIIKRRENSTRTPEDTIVACREVHGDRYEYDISSITNSHSKMRIKCKDHGWFECTPVSHMGGVNCLKCGNIESGKKRLHLPENTIAACRKVHGDLYEYDVSSIVDAKTKMRIICSTHGEFFQSPNGHMSGYGCPKCAIDNRAIHKSRSPEDTIAACREVHGDLYEYDVSSIGYSRNKMRIICSVHGEFFQTPNDHMNGQGCSSCSGAGPSNEENAVADYVSSICNAEVLRSDRKILDGKELDIYIPSKKLAIEYCGLYWHGENSGKSKNYHKEKYDICKQHGIHLITIFSDEWVNHSDNVKAAIKSILGDRKSGVAARKCTVMKVPASIANTFYNQYHLQGGGVSGQHYALMNDTDIVAMMTFGHPQRKSKWGWELRRFATDDDGHIGAAGKLLKAFQREHNFPSIVSFSDRRWFDGHMYATLGFMHDGELKPDYNYFRYNQRHHKSTFRKSSIKKKFPDIYDDNLTEHVMMINAGYDRIYDCGKDRWVIEVIEVK